MPSVKKTTVIKEPKVVERSEVTFNVPKIKLPKFLRHFQGFTDFIRSYGVITLAVGIFLGTSLKTVLDAITVGLINPVISVLTGNFNLAALSVCIKRSSGSVCESSINYGIIISAIISFVIAAFMVFLIIRLFRLDKLVNKK